MRLQIKVKCPYCGFENKVLISMQYQVVGPEIMTCDSEEGGCDKCFVRRISVKTETTGFKIEGEDES